MSKNTTKRINIFLFLLPALFLFVAILVVPIVSSVYYSFFNFSMIDASDKTFVLDEKEDTSTVVGDALTAKETDDRSFFGKLFENYIELFENKNLYDMGKALKNAFILAALSVFIQLPLSLGLALMLGRGIKGERLYLSVYFVPVLISSVVIGALWSKIYDPSHGVILFILEKLGCADILPAKGLLGDDSTALLAVFIPTIWQYVGYHMLLMYAGVKSVSPELREAAKLDGATDGQVDRYVVIPSIKQIIKVSVIFAITGSLKSYDLIKIFARSKYDVPYNVPSLMLVKNVFGGHGGEGNAIAVMLIILCFAFAILINWIFKERDIYGGKKYSKQQ